MDEFYGHNGGTWIFSRQDLTRKASSKQVSLLKLFLKLNWRSVVAFEAKPVALQAMLWIKKIHGPGPWILFDHFKTFFDNIQHAAVDV